MIPMVRVWAGPQAFVVTNKHPVCPAVGGQLWAMGNLNTGHSEVKGKRAASSQRQWDFLGQ